MRLLSLSPFFRQNADLLAQYAAQPTLWHKEASQALSAHDADLTIDELMGVLLDTQRIIRVFHMGLQYSGPFRDNIAYANPMSWDEFSSPDAPADLQEALAAQLFNISSRDDIATLEVGDTARLIGASLFEKCVASGAAFDVQFVDPVFNAISTVMADLGGVQRYATYLRDRRLTATKRMHVSYNLPVFDIPKSDDAKDLIHQDIMRPVRIRSGSGALLFTLTSIPTARDAEVDGIPYPEYIRLFFESCDQPWSHIKVAQARLIETLNNAKTLRFTNNDGTDLTMDIDGFTFCNSVTAKNIPGSEVFSAPRIDSTNGIIIAKGRFALKDNEKSIAEDLTLRFENGYLAEFDARVGRDKVAETVGVDQGARYIGEIGIGTNPHLKRHVASILLSEKIGGSFHVALGDAYTMTDYLGDPVRVDNGNRSHLHWDITTMLHGKDGRIYADDAVIMENGLFVDPALDILNRGWAAVPEAERPAYWREKLKTAG